MHPIFAAFLALALPGFLLNPILNFVLPTIAGIMTSLLYGYLKKASSFLDALPPQAHTFVVGALSFILPLIGHIVPGFNGTSLNDVSASTVQALVLLFISQLTHFITNPPAIPAAASK